MIEEDGKLVGFNVSVGGGMGATFGDESTYPRLADYIGFITPEELIPVAEKVIEIQRDFGNRVDRKHARIKYTIAHRGIDWFVDELQKRLGYTLAPNKPFIFTTNGDLYGWLKGINNRWFYTLFVENGRVRDAENYTLKTALREIAQVHTGDFRLTGNQNLIIGNVKEEDKAEIEAILIKHGVINDTSHTGLRRNAIACVALNTCGLAFAEAERYLPSLITKLDVIIRKYGLDEEAITIRMTGCPNGCGRSRLGEIGFIGKSPGRYNLYLGASHNGDRLNTLYLEQLDEAQILKELEPIIKSYAEERKEGETFGDFVHRKEIVQ